MEFFSAGVPVGRYFGIVVRLHFTFIVFAIWRLMASEHFGLALAFIAGLYVCILLHEFGHALATRWCGGEAHEILLWPLGGLAFVVPPFHPTAHFISTVAGPLVTLVLWLLFWTVAWWLKSLAIASSSTAVAYVVWFAAQMSGLNLFLLVFNLIPAFPMDGGRILRDTLWHWIGAERATQVAVTVSRVIALTGILFAGFALLQWGGIIRVGGYRFDAVMLLLVAIFVLLSSRTEQQVVDLEGRGAYGFSLRERLERGRRQREFRSAVAQLERETQTTSFHRCAVCGRTERDSPTLDFRVCTDCANYEEYCEEHINAHQHT